MASGSKTAAQSAAGTYSVAAASSHCPRSPQGGFENASLYKDPTRSNDENGDYTEGQGTHQSSSTIWALKQKGYNAFACSRAAVSISCFIALVGVRAAGRVCLAVAGSACGAL